MDDQDELTEVLRTDESPLSVRLRTLLKARGVEPGRAVLAERFTDDNSLEFGIVVAETGEVFQFDYDYLRRDIGDGVFAQWNDLTETWPASPHHERVRAAL